MPNFQGDSCSYLTYSLHPHSPWLYPLERTDFGLLFMPWIFSAAHCATELKV